MEIFIIALDIELLVIVVTSWSPPSEIYQSHQLSFPILVSYLLILMTCRVVFGSVVMTVETVQFQIHNKWLTQLYECFLTMLTFCRFFW